MSIIKAGNKLNGRIHVNGQRWSSMVSTCWRTENLHNRHRKKRQMRKTRQAGGQRDGQTDRPASRYTPMPRLRPLCQGPADQPPAATVTNLYRYSGDTGVQSRRLRLYYWLLCFTPSQTGLGFEPQCLQSACRRAA